MAYCDFFTDPGEKRHKYLKCRKVFGRRHEVTKHMNREHKYGEFFNCR